VEGGAAPGENTNENERRSRSLRNYQQNWTAWPFPLDVRLTSYWGKGVGIRGEDGRRRPFPVLPVVGRVVVCTE